MTSRVSVKVDGVKELRGALAEVGRTADGFISDAVNATGLELQGNIKKGYDEPGKVGRVYEKYKPRRTHRASEEGQAPATDTGRLKNSVTFTEVGKLTVTVSTKVAYGHYLEFGTFDIAPRPLWVPEANAIAPKFKKRIEDAIARAIK